MGYKHYGIDGREMHQQDQNPHTKQVYHQVMISIGLKRTTKQNINNKQDVTTEETTW